MGAGATRALAFSALCTLTLALTSCASVHDPKPVAKVTRSANPYIIREIAYARAHYSKPNREVFGDLGGTDCVNFTSQTLLARGWKLNPKWTYKGGYARAWISSTGFHDYLAQHPELATELTWSQRSRASVGDVVQFDWDNSGDRDHTGIISGFETLNGKREILVSSHSPAAFDWPITDVVAEHGPPTQIYIWHLKG